ncbi:MAG TPA: nitronate monooxygenase [Trebonia sp.]|jgi:NAD(P)H-dependent flavin oxidoreductase YrpB (nitropropane dioxygenase family)|nr:nitronate monooxygenase [Trebonia sp.]
MSDPDIPVLRELGVRLPVLAAPMAGGPSTPELVTAAWNAGSLGFLAAGYKSASDLEAQAKSVAADGAAFGVNLFVPSTVPVSADDYRRYARALAAEAAPYGIDLESVPLTEDDDAWADKLDVVLAARPAVVTTTFGIPAAGDVRALRAAGITVGMTVTSAAEAQRAAAAGADLLVVQGSAAGGHSGTMTPGRLPEQTDLAGLAGRTRAVTALPVIAAGGIATSADVSRVLAAGADAVAVGTVLLRTGESGASATHRAALVDPAFDHTVVTRSFTGRPARALANQWTASHEDEAPLGYPAIHHLTTALRRAAAAAGDPHRVHLWAGTGWRGAREEPVAQALGRLADF